MHEFIIVLLIAAVLGHLAQSTGLCMVRGMNEWMAGKPGFIAAILCSGVLAWVSGVLAAPLGYELPFSRLEISGWFALGGLLFGAGAAFNQGCGVSTLSKLSRGEVEMIATISGWLLGWYALERWGPEPVHDEMGSPGLLSFLVLAGVSIGLAAWLIFSKRERRKTWFGMMGIGLLAGFLFLYERSWTPSGLLHDLSYSLRSGEPDSWPAPHRYLIILALLGGMLFAALRGKRFKLTRLRWKPILTHLLAGCLMGVGAALAKGGNDSLLLLAMPAFSPAGFIAVGSMLVGLFVGLKLRERMVSPSNRPYPEH
jgi:hypothetical protein